MPIDYVVEVFILKEKGAVYEQEAKNQSIHCCGNFMNYQRIVNTGDNFFHLI